MQQIFFFCNSASFWVASIILFLLFSFSLAAVSGNDPDARCDSDNRGVVRTTAVRNFSGPVHVVPGAHACVTRDHAYVVHAHDKKSILASFPLATTEKKQEKQKQKWQISISDGLK